MILYDECINNASELMEGFSFRDLSSKKRKPWKDAGKDQLIFRNDMAYELGGGTLPAMSGILLSDQRPEQDELLLSGPDLSELKADSPYARIAVIRVSDELLGTGPDLYNHIRQIDYTRYHVNPEGFMMCIAATTGRESVRVGKDALKKGLSFADAGQLFVNAYHRHEAVLSVQLIFITDPDFPYKKLAGILEKAENITKALDHLSKNLRMDCDTCNLQEICAEVEKLAAAEKSI